MPVCLLFLCVFQTKIHPQPLWHYYSIYKSLLPNVRHMPRGMSYNLRANIEWGEKHWSSIESIHRLLIKTRQCFRLLDSNRMFSALCQWRLQWENCWTNHSSPKSWTISISVFKTKAVDQCCHYMSLLWYHCLLHFLFLELFSPTS